jgi:hypothetical protein
VELRRRREPRPSAAGEADRIAREAAPPRLKPGLIRWAVAFTTLTRRTERPGRPPTLRWWNWGMFCLLPNFQSKAFGMDAKGPTLRSAQRRSDS